MESSGDRIVSPGVVGHFSANGGVEWLGSADGCKGFMPVVSDKVITTMGGRLCSPEMAPSLLGCSSAVEGLRKRGVLLLFPVRAWTRRGEDLTPATRELNWKARDRALLLWAPLQN